MIITNLYINITTYDFKNYRVHSDEVEEARFWTKNQIENKLGKGVFTPNFEYEFGLLQTMKLIRSVYLFWVPF